ncbi:8860_t:CDS:2 [Paraglomus brasilianum]|uniref:DNA topoisomerase 2 n=1 Tax=Paraglomus brasilianum TaxID=144538 RepID=A0A9N9DHQ1_9GLOM|nr:8860_t:CDS:2 [Paraglomus brasilianum]
MVTAPLAPRVKKTEETYQKVTQIEHIVKRPDTYIGSVQVVNDARWVFDKNKEAMTHRLVTFVPGLYKIFDEILVNAADNKIRDPSMDTIKVTIDAADNTISIYNNGQGIPVEVHKKENVYVPELIFGHLLTSSNYDDDEKKVTGGRNGYGAKLLYTAADNTNLVYGFLFAIDIMGQMSQPKLTTASKKEDFTRITFKPDLGKFGMTTIDKDTEALLVKLVYDLAGSEDEGTKPTLITKILTIDGKLVFASVMGPTDQLVREITETIKKKFKQITPPKPSQIKNHLWIFLNCLIENLAFDSQTKDTLTLQRSAFGSTAVLSDDFVKKSEILSTQIYDWNITDKTYQRLIKVLFTFFLVLKTNIIDNIAKLMKVKQEQQLRKTDGHKLSRISGIAKLDDANQAGTRNGSRCTLILTEGDSAKALAVSGLSIVGRDHFGVFP